MVQGIPRNSKNKFYIDVPIRKKGSSDLEKCPGYSSHVVPELWESQRSETLKGDRSHIKNQVNNIPENRFYQRTLFVFPITPEPDYEITPSLISPESCHQGASNDAGSVARGSLFMANVGNYRTCPSRNYIGILVPSALGIFFPVMFPTT